MTVDDRVRAAERRRLARELHDVVAHHLANITLRTMGQVGVTDLSRLSAVLADVDRAAGSAQVELRLLAHVLEDDPELLAGDSGVSALDQRLTPTAAAEQWCRRLVRAGRFASASVPAAADRLALSVQSTIARTLDTTGAAALVHTAVNARCLVTLDLDPAEVTLRSTLALPAAGSAQERELELELRGLRERVDLSQGQLSAAVHSSAARQRAWVVVVTLPLG